MKIDQGLISCDKCGGRVFSDRENLSEVHLELYCIACGKRWIYRHPANHGNFAIWLHNEEMVLREWTTNH